MLFFYLVFRFLGFTLILLYDSITHLLSLILSTMSKKTIIRSAGVISLATLLSRILGLVREIIFADLFGANFITDAFRVAHAIPYTLRRLLGEGAMSAFLVPVFTEIRNKEGEQAAKEFANTVFTVFSLLVVGIIAIYIAIAPGIIYLMAPGLAQNPQAFDLAVFLSRLMIPYMLLMMSSALSMGILNSYRHFFSPAMAPVVMNLAVIIALLYLCPRMGDTTYMQIQGMAYGILAGGILQVLIQFPALIKRGFIYRPRFNICHPGIKRMLILMGPAVFVIGVVRFNILMDTLMSSFLGEGNISYLSYGERLLQFPLGALGFGISTAILPLLSQYCAEKNDAKYKETLNFAFRLVLVLCIPATLGLAVLASPTVRLIYQHGQFTATDTLYTTQVLLAFVVGLVGFVGIQVVVPAFYSKQDTKTPLKAAVVGLVANLFFNLTLMFPLGIAGIALSTSLATYINLIILLWLLRRKVGLLGLRGISRTGIKVTLASLPMAGVAYGLWWYLDRLLGRSNSAQVVVISVVIVMAVGVYIAVAKLLRVEEIDEALGIVKRKFFRGKGKEYEGGIGNGEV